MQPRAATEGLPAPSPFAFVALMFSIVGLVMCALMAFGLLALPVLGPLHLYSSIGLHALDLWALTLGALGPVPAALGLGLGLWARREAKKRAVAPTSATAAIVVALAALALTALAWAANAHVAETGSLF